MSYAHAALCVLQCSNYGREYYPLKCCIVSLPFQVMQSHANNYFIILSCLYNYIGTYTSRKMRVPTRIYTCVRVLQESTCNIQLILLNRNINKINRWKRRGKYYFSHQYAVSNLFEIFSSSIVNSCTYNKMQLCFLVFLNNL